MQTNMKLYSDQETPPAIKVLRDHEPTPVDYAGNQMLDKSQDLLYWRDFALNKCTDYSQLRSRVREQLNIKTWLLLSDEEKNFIIEINLKEDALSSSQDAANKIQHLIQAGLCTDNESARLYLVECWSEHHIREIEACRSRATTPKIHAVVMKYISIVDASDFFFTVDTLFSAFEKQGIKGITEGHPNVGLFDYIESTIGTVYEFAGLKSKGYSMLTGDLDETNLIADLMGILRDGEY